jgi:pimeloyl-ACP methyl ester carboxylesterase
MRATREGVSLYYEAEGEGETVVFVGEAGYGAWQWGWQHRAVAGPYRALAYDHRGTGRSDAPAGPYSVPELAADLDAVLADAGADSAHLVGLGLGGAVAIEYAFRFGRARSLALLGTAASGGRFDTEGLEGLGEPGLDGALSEGFLADNPDVAEGIAEWREGDAGAEGFAAQRAALAGFERSEELYECPLPALVLHGGADAVVPEPAGEDLADGLPRGEFRSFSGAGHLLTVERSRPVNDALLAFLEGRATER